MLERPILILQMQRMGDLVMSFPLLGWLRKMYPKTPIWVVSEEFFFKPLMALSPDVTYFAYSSTGSFTGINFELVINLSHRQEAAKIAGEVISQHVIGPYLKNGTLYVNGDWQLYRTSITHNNRHNLFHWADLNALDVIPKELLPQTFWPPLKHKPISADGARIGIFVGASAPEKHPQKEFWVKLTKSILDMGHKPVLLGGEAEKNFGMEIAHALGIAKLNLCGRFSVKELASFIDQLNLFVTPDTGPMHVATWVGTPVLNISLGNVNPWETGPFCPGHYVLRANLACSGCWECTREKLFCHDMINHEKVAEIIKDVLLENQPEFPISNLELLQTGRTQKTGLFNLQTLAGSHNADNTYSPANFWMERSILGYFWQAYFTCILNFQDDTSLQDQSNILKEHSPQIATHMKGAAAKLLMDFSKASAGKRNELLGKHGDWQKFHTSIWPLTGYLQMFLGNAQYTPESIKQGLNSVERLCAYI